MCKFLLQTEPSSYQRKHLPCGNCETQENSHIVINHKIIVTEGFQNLQEAIFVRSGSKSICLKDNCGINTSTNFIVNAHVFIKLDVRNLDSLKIFLNCKVKDFPPNITMYNEALMFVLFHSILIEIWL